jgi:hypothetical protein
MRTSLSARPPPSGGVLTVLLVEGVRPLHHHTRTRSVAEVTVTTEERKLVDGYNHIKTANGKRGEGRSRPKRQRARTSKK